MSVKKRQARAFGLRAKFIGVIAASLTLAACGGSGSGGDKSDEIDEVVFGNIGPFTGPNSAIGEQWMNGVNLAVEEINAAGGIKSLGGAKLKALNGDHTGKPEVAIAETERAIEKDAVAVIGAMESAMTLPSSQITERQGVPYIVPISASPEITKRGFKHIFRIIEASDTGAVTASTQLREVVDAAGDDINTVAILHEDSVAGTAAGTNMEAALKKDGFDVLTRVTYNKDAADLTPEVSKVAAKKPDILVTNGYYNDSALVLKTMERLDFNVKVLFGLRVPSYSDPTFLKDMDGLAEYVFNSDIGLDQVGDKGKAIADKYQDKYGRALTVLALYPYASVYVLADALERAGSTDHKKVTEALRATDLGDLPLAAGNVKFDEVGNNSGALSLLTQAIEGATPVVAPKKFAVREPVLPMPKWKERG